MEASSTSRDPERFLAHLEHQQILSSHASQRALRAVRQSGHAFDTVMTELGLLGERELADHLSRFLNLAPMSGESNLRPDAVGDLPLSFLRDHGLLPISFDKGELVLGVADPFSTSGIEALAFYFELKPILRILPRREIIDAIAQFEDQFRDPVEAQDPAQRESEAGPDDLERLKDFAREAPIVRFVADMIDRAIDAKATDIHVEPAEDHIRIRFRNDGMLSIVDTAPLAMLSGISTRIKILARLNIAERRLPQDGRLRISVRGREVDLRVSVIPSIHGEALVLRILDRSGIELCLERLGFQEEAISSIRSLANSANGIVLVTGPTGSGKTTTLYSALAERIRDEVKIFTVEDPVEYRMEGVTQLQVNPMIDLDFAAALRSILRQDPDIILVGEIRDRETAQIAIQAALTGHLVFSTLHTNSAASALTRLRDMGLDDYLLGATIRGIVAQRLLRKRCPTCGPEAYPSCRACGGSGLKGRTAAYEILTVSQRIAAMIDNGATETQIVDQALNEGMVTMQVQSMQLVRDGTTTPEEIHRVLAFNGAA